MRLLLINPGFGPLVSRGRHNRPWPPLDLLGCAALAEEKGHQARLLDLRARPRTPGEIREEADKADLILLTTSPLDRWQCPNLELEPVRDLARLLPRLLTRERLFVCGAQGSLFPEELLQLTRAAGVIRGEPEEAFGELAAGRPAAEIAGLILRQGDGIQRNPERPPVDISRLPLPAYHLVDLADYSYALLGQRTGLIETARGCPFHCPFCLKVMYPTGLRTKPAGRVLEEVDRLVRDHKAGSIYFFDLEFTARREATEELCRGLMERGGVPPWACQTRLDALDGELIRLLGRAGCTLIHFGVETADPELQARAKKPIDPVRARGLIAEAGRAGVRTAAFFLLGLGGQSAGEAAKSLDLARHLEPTYASFHLQTPYPGTPWGEPAGSWADWSRAQQQREEEWAGVVRGAYRRFYLRPGYLLRALSGRAGLREGWRLFRGLGG